jgi:ADP-ribosyl-[dinitrogen reductase] hydrolase
MAGRYQRELEAATQAALHAGTLLRDEFHRPGGARGGGGHADIDEIAEADIFRRLSAAFPDYGFRGEELGYRGEGRDPDRHIWIVDPNDGTSDYLRGFRGASVAIALVRRGTPVLGVVYAYAAPDDDGDLIAWAEGCGPVQRNGTPVQRSWPAAPTEESTVLVSTYADQRIGANLRAIGPMRFRGTPSIAYRLALIACGDADATISLNSPSSWDYAAGHALLLATGGLLVSGSGCLIQYDDDGIAHCGATLSGGGESLVTELMDRDWREVLNGYRDRRNPFCHPVKGRHVRDAGMLSRAQGCLIGQIAGDSLGSLVEFKSPEEIAARYPEGLSRLRTGGVWGTLAGQPTDDSEMALALARALVRARTYDFAQVQQAYLRWYESQPFDMGSTTRAALAGDVPNNTSQANGALMRISPVGIALPPEEAWRAAHSDAELTHPHPVCRDASAIFAATISFAIRTGANAEAAHEYAESHATEEAVRAVLKAARVSAPQDYTRQQGWVLIALQNAFYQLLHAPSVESGVSNTVMRGGDTDTNGAIAGALLGAVHGLRRMPHQWTDRVITCRPMESMPGVKRPRPLEYWPIDALCLAERLLRL